MWPFASSPSPPAAAPAAGAQAPATPAAPANPNLNPGQPGFLNDAGEILADTKNKLVNVTSNAGNVLANAGNQVNEAMGTIGSKIKNVPTLFNDVSNSTMYQNVTSWLSSDSIFSKLLFVIVAMVIFFFLLRISLILITYLVPSISSPYLVSGVLEGSKALELQQDPRVEDSKMITRSKNQKSGIEFTWCVWLMIGQSAVPAGQLNKEYVIFSKGHPQTQNGPKVSVGLQKMKSGTETESATSTTDAVGGISAYLLVSMDTYQQNQSSNVSTVKVTNIPMKKWVHICVRLQNTALDIYVNGNATRRIILPEVPVQNFGNVYVFPESANTPQNEKFVGFLSDLIYYPYSLNAYRLNALVESGPNTKPSVFATTAETTSSGNYLSTLWYSNQRV